MLYISNNKDFTPPQLNNKSYNLKNKLNIFYLKYKKMILILSILIILLIITIIYKSLNNNPVAFEEFSYMNANINDIKKNKNLKILYHIIRILLKLVRRYLKII